MSHRGPARARARGRTPWWVAAGVALALGSGRPAWSQDLEEDPLSLAAMLVSDGNLDRAAAVLDGVDAEQPDLDTVRYWTLRGLVALRQGLSSQAVAALEQAVAASPEPVEPALWLSLARARVLAGDDRGALEALDAASDDLAVFPGAWLVRARAAWRLGDQSGAWRALEEGARRFPDELDFPRQQVLHLVEMGLTREASERASVLLERADGTVTLALAVAEAMRRAGQHERAIVVLEEAILRWPDDDTVRIRLAAAHASAEQPLAAARLLQQVAERDPGVADEAAELFRRAGRDDAALMMNALVPDPVEKVRQRFGILLDLGDFERALALQPRLSRLGLLDDDNIRYGVAYAWFRVGGYDEAESLLRGVADPRVFQQASELRQAMEAERGPASSGRQR